MPEKRISMQKIKEVLRLRLEARLLIRQISIRAIQKLLSQANTLEIVWPLPEDLNNGQLAAMFYPGFDPVSSSRYEVPDWTTAYQELKHKTSPNCCCGKSTPPNARSVLQLFPVL
jgi:hypothetical protein